MDRSNRAYSAIVKCLNYAGPADPVHLLLISLSRRSGENYLYYFSAVQRKISNRRHD